MYPLEDAIFAGHCGRQLDRDQIMRRNDVGRYGIARRSVAQSQQISVQTFLSNQLFGRAFIAQTEFEISQMADIQIDVDLNQLFFPIK